MDVRVHGANLHLTTKIKNLAEEKVEHASRIFGDHSAVDVEFTEAHNPRIADDRVRVEITSFVHGQIVRAEAAGPDDRSALDRAIDKFERQLRKLKERLVQRSRKPKNKQLNDPAPTPDDALGMDQNIVRTKRHAMRPMTAEEAALEMEMIGHDFFFFLDAETGNHAVLYHRKDGSLGLIEPE